MVKRDGIWRVRQLTAVLDISNNRMALIGKLNANLMVTAGVKFNFNIGGIIFS